MINFEVIFVQDSWLRFCVCYLWTDVQLRQHLLKSYLSSVKLLLQPYQKSVDLWVVCVFF